MQTKHILCYILIILLPTVLYSCKTSKSSTSKASSTQHSIDWAGTYEAVSIGTNNIKRSHVLTLNNDNSYKFVTVLGRVNNATPSNNMSKAPIIGKFEVNKKGTEITLDKNVIGNDKFILGEQKLIPIKDTTLIFNKVMGMSNQDNKITEKYWKLVAINGQPVSNKLAKEPHIILKESENRLAGNGGCNSLFGTYEISSGNRISFSKIGSTKMACLNMETEQALFRVLETADNYSINGDKMTLNKARMAPLASFEAVYLK